MARGTAKSSRLPWQRAHLSRLANARAGGQGKRREKNPLLSESVARSMAHGRLHHTSAPDGGRVQRRQAKLAAVRVRHCTVAR